MNKYQEITAARKLLELPETATMESIKSSYRKLMAKWHPDKCTENQKTRTEMTHNIILAYQIIWIIAGIINTLFLKRR